MAGVVDRQDGFRARRDAGFELARIEPVVVEGDDLRLRELLLNLVDNAVKYSQEGQTVELALAVVGDQAKIMVQDHGIGIAPENHARVFDRFYRTDDAQEA